MTRNPFVTMAVEVMTAIEALKLKRHHLVSVADGVEIHQPGKPVVLLRYSDAEAFAHSVDEARA